MLEDPEYINEFSKKIGKNVHLITAIIGEGLKDLLTDIKQMVDQLPPPSREEVDEFFTLEEKTDQKYTIEKLPDGTYFVDGGLVDFLIQNVTISDIDSFAFFQKVLKDRGVMHDLRKMGIKEGDIVSIGDIEFEWYD